jgi:hypothetical protein
MTSLNTWWSSARLDNTCESDSWNRASTYLITLLIIFTVIWLISGKTSVVGIEPRYIIDIVRVVAILGTIMTVHQWSRKRCNTMMTVIICILHIIPYIMLRYEEFSKTWRGKLLAVVVLGAILFAYAPILSNGSWPYSLAPVTVMMGAIVVVLVGGE